METRSAANYALRSAPASYQGPLAGSPPPTSIASVRAAPAGPRWRVAPQAGPPGRLHSPEVWKTRSNRSARRQSRHRSQVTSGSGTVVQTKQTLLRVGGAEPRRQLSNWRRLGRQSSWSRRVCHAGGRLGSRRWPRWTGRAIPAGSGRSRRIGEHRVWPDRQGQPRGCTATLDLLPTHFTRAWGDALERLSALYPLGSPALHAPPRSPRGKTASSWPESP